MKRMKRILCLIALFAMCLSLCGCSVLDDLRAMRATMTPDGTIKLYDGTEYKPLPECEELSPKFTQYQEVYIVEEDIPLLLTTTRYNDYLDKSDDGKLLVAYTNGSALYYCRTDVYDSVLERIQNGPTPEQCYYWSFDYETQEHVCYTLTQAQWDAVQQVCTTQKPQRLTDNLMESVYWVDLFLCTEDRMFEWNAPAICINDGKYYVLDYDSEYAYLVPEELTAVFEEIMALEVGSDTYWN